MIVRMKEILLFTLSSQVDETVQELGELGVVEIKEITASKTEELEVIQDKINQTEKAISILENYVENNHSKTKTQEYDLKDPIRFKDRILIADSFKKRCLNRLDTLNKQLEWYQVWGEKIDTKDFAYLRANGIYVRLYFLEKAALNSLPKNQNLVTFSEQGDKIPVALFTRSKSEKLEFKEDEPPKLSFKEVNRQIVRKKRQLEAVKFYLSDQSEDIAFLNEYMDDLEDRLNTQKVLEGMGNIEDSIKYLKGFIPEYAIDRLKNKATHNNWGYQISVPENPEEVPVYIKNPKWVSIINPVMKFIDIVPGYKEVDVSIYFLIAFSLFFAMLVGDAGYGAIFMLITLLVRKRLSEQLRLLIYVLSGATILWGVFSGTYFGSEQIAAMPFFNNLIIPEIASFGVNNISFMMHLSFLIGAIHLTIAHGIRAFQFINSIKMLSEIGWIAFIWGLFFVAEKLVLGRVLPEWNSWLFIVGATLVILFSKEGKNLINSMLTSIANLPLSLINGFSDIVSYVRLFAVGMATATVASSFNNMIVPAGADLSFLGLIMAAIALFLGHGLNIILALMAVMVHGIRLNMLEFSGHLGVQFSGEAYKPFKLKSARKKLNVKD